MSKLAILTLSALGLTLSSCLSTHAPSMKSDYRPLQEEQSVSGSATVTEEESPRRAFRLTGESEVRLSGSATIGSWSSASRTLRAELDPGVEPEQIAQLVERLKVASKSEASGELTQDVMPELTPAQPPVAAVEVQVTSLRSGNSKMDADMHKALKAEAHPQISYQLTEIDGASWHRLQDGSGPIFVLQTVGDLSLAGVTRSVQMSVRIHPQDEETFSVIGRKRLSMKDFSIKPPTALFGLIKADETVEVVFDLQVRPADSPEPAD